MLTLKIIRGRSSFRKPFLATLAILLGVVAIAYGSIWMYAVRSGPRVELGFNKVHSPPYDEKMHSQSVEDVVEGSPAELAGLRAGDRIIGVDGRARSVEFQAASRFGREYSRFDRDENQVLRFGGVVGKFRLYWSLVGPFSGLIRKAILKQAKTNAESKTP